jgi:hypothetical protein
MIDRISSTHNKTSIPTSQSENLIARQKIVCSQCSIDAPLSNPCSWASKIQSYLVNASAHIALFFKELWTKWIGLFAREQNESPATTLTTHPPSPPTPARNMPRGNTPLSQITPIPPPSTLPDNRLVASHIRSAPQSNPDPSSRSQMMPATDPVAPPLSTTPSPSSSSSAIPQPSHPIPASDGISLRPPTLNPLPQSSTPSIPTFSDPAPSLIQPSPPVPEPSLTLPVQAPYERTEISPSPFPLLPYQPNTFDYLHPIQQVYMLLSYAEKLHLKLNPPEELLDAHTGKLQIMPLINENTETPCKHVIDRAILIELMKKGPQSIQIRKMLQPGASTLPVQIDCPCCLASANNRNTAAPIGKWKICIRPISECPLNEVTTFFLREVKLDHEKIQATSEWLRTIFYLSQEFQPPEGDSISKRNNNTPSIKKFFLKSSYRSQKDKLNYLMHYVQTAGIELFPPRHLIDPISGKIFREPVRLDCDHIVDFRSLQTWVKTYSMISHPDVWKCPHQNCSRDIPLHLINSQILPADCIDQHTLKTTTLWLMNTLDKFGAIKKDENYSIPSEDELRPIDPFDVNNPFHSCAFEDHSEFANPIPAQEADIPDPVGHFEISRVACIEKNFNPTSPVALQISPDFATLGDRIQKTEHKICMSLRTFIEKLPPSFEGGQSISDLDGLTAKLKLTHPLCPENHPYSDTIGKLIKELSLFKKQDKFYDTSTYEPLYHPLSEHPTNSEAAPHVFAKSTVERILSQKISNCPTCRKPWDLKIDHQNASLTTLSIPEEAFREFFAENSHLQKEFFDSISKLHDNIQAILKDQSEPFPL